MSGFLRGHSCATALIKLTDDWRVALDQKKEVGTIAIDLSKAFDSICHNLLLAKLKAYGLRDSALQLMRSYLKERKQRVKCNGVYSNWLPLRCGVPQGSLLGPLLFNIFVNDVNQTVNNSSLRLYADDTTQYASDLSPAVLQYSLNQDIHTLSGWFNENFLQINGAKTQAMILGKSSYNYDLRIVNNTIKIEDTLKILGVTLDKSLTFKPHVTEMLKKTYAKIAALRRLKRMVPVDILIKLYNAYILPHLEYCSPILIETRLALASVLGPFGSFFEIHSTHPGALMHYSWFQSLVLTPVVNPDSSPSVQSPVHVYRPWENTRDQLQWNPVNTTTNGP